MSQETTPDPVDAIVQGIWTYRSLQNNPAVATDFNDLEFGRGMITFGSVADDLIDASELDMGGGYKLTLKGRLIRSGGQVVGLEWRGEGIPGTVTAGWIYDYQGAFTLRWPNGVNQAQVIVGSTIRTVPHGTAPAGYVGTIYMVRND